MTTILDVADAQMTTEGSSLLSGIERSQLLLEAAPSRAGSQKSPGFCGLRTQRYLFLEYTTGELELYDYSKDRYELNNVAGKAAYRNPLQLMRQSIPGLGCDLAQIRGMPGAGLDESGD